MVANIRTGATVGGAVRYNEEKVNRGQAEVLFWNRMLDPFNTTGRMSYERCMASFEPFLQANRRTTNTVFHVSLNPSPEDRLTDEQLGEIAANTWSGWATASSPTLSSSTETSRANTCTLSH